MKESDIVLRINKLMDIYGLNISQFSYRAGINQSNMSAMLSGKRVIGEGIINKISMSFDIDKKWLTSGIGEMKKSIVSEALPIYGVPYMMVPFIPVTARAGYLRGFGDQEYIDNLSTIPVMVDKNYRGKYRVFEIEGDSMENSDIKSSLYDNDKYLCREVKRELWDSKLHIKDWYFVIVHKLEGILVKEIVSHNVETCEIICHSLNPMFDDFSICLNDVSELYNVIKLVDRNIRK